MPINSFLYPGAKFTPAYEVANSCRWNGADDPSMLKTSADGNQRTFTFSAWIKRSSSLGARQTILDSTFSSSEHRLFFETDDILEYYDYASSAYQFRFKTNRKFRDISAWMNIVLAVDTTQGTAANRIKIYVNGTQVTSFSTETYPSADADMKICGDTLHIIGGVWTDDRGGDLDAYLAETVLIGIE